MDKEDTAIQNTADAVADDALSAFEARNSQSPDDAKLQTSGLPDVELPSSALRQDDGTIQAALGTVRQLVESAGLGVEQSIATRRAALRASRAEIQERV